MSELLQEYVDSRSQRLRVDREAGVIRGVKLLGLASRNGRRYREQALAEAVALYEGAKVNINHPKGHPLSPRDYQDRLGLVRGVEFRAGEGLFGELHFNPRHALSDQLVWDAEHAPQNVGMSHNVLARTSRSGEETIVEAITKVQSIDLVADPATTSGLYEQSGSNADPKVERAGATGLFSWDALALDELKRHRPDLVQEIELAGESRLAVVQEELVELQARDAAARRRQQIFELLAGYRLPVPGDGSESGQNPVLSEQFMQMLLAAPDDAALEQLIADRAQLVEWARDRSREPRPTETKPRSRDQLATIADGGRRIGSGKEFAAAVRRA
jgi:hypothetical protein